METLTRATLQRGWARLKRHFPTVRPRQLIPSWSTAKNRLAQDFTPVPPRWLSGARMGCGTKEQAQSWGACVSPVKREGWLCPCAVLLAWIGLDLPRSTAHSVLWDMGHTLPTPDS